MTIKKITVWPVALPVKRPTRISTRLLSRREYLIVEVEAEGSEMPGIGYTYAGTSGGLLLADAVRDLLAPVLIGAEPEDIVSLYDQMYQETLLVGRRGALIRALSAVDIALWDLSAKRANMPLAVLLGGTVKPIPAYASGGYYRPDDGPWDKAVASEIEDNRSRGFTDHKIKVGGLSVEEDARRVAAAMSAVGDGRLALDANNAYRSVTEALRALRAFERAAGDHGLWWFEEPLSPDAIAEHSELAAIAETPIATGEIAQTRHEFRDLIQRKAADILQPDAGVLGGVTEWIRVARTAETFNIAVAPHWHANLHAQLAAATPNCIAIEHFGLEKDIYNFELLVRPETRLQADGGFVELTRRPGVGIELDYSVLTGFLADR